MFTAGSNIVTAEKTKKLGSDDYIVKPFEPKELTENVEMISA